MQEPACRDLIKLTINPVAAELLITGDEIVTQRKLAIQPPCFCSIETLVASAAALATKVGLV
jgi:hypothetical protein